MHRMSYVWGGFYCSAYNVTQIKKRVKTLTYYKSGEGDDGEPEPMAEEEEEEEDEEEEDDGGTGELPETQRDATTVEHDEELFRNNKLRLATPYSTDGEAEEIPEAWAKAEIGQVSALPRSRRKVWRAAKMRRQLMGIVTTTCLSMGRSPLRRLLLVG